MKTFREFQVENASHKHDYEVQDVLVRIINDVSYLNAQNQTLQKEFSIMQKEILDIKSQL